MEERRWRLLRRLHHGKDWLRTKLNLVSGLKRHRFGKLLAVHEGAVGATKVVEGEGPISFDELRVRT
eukprot:8419669-Pyramimonas_sp.AAC.1